MKLDVNAGLQLARLPQDHRLSHLLRLMHPEVQPERVPLENLLDAAFFNLDRCFAYHQADEEIQARIRATCTATLLEEAVAIERMGLAFAAKMLLVASTQEERIFYAQMAAEEALHLQWIEAWLPAPNAPIQQPFLTSLAHWIEEGASTSLLLLVQVVLEGWGLAHYRQVMAHCLNEKMISQFRVILGDEARHHCAGEILLEGRSFQPMEQDFTLECLRQLIGQIRLGPLRVMAVVEENLGPFDAPARLELWRELGGPRQVELRLNLLRELLARGPKTLFTLLEAEGSFLPIGVSA
jgi:rubrerythrin